MKIVFAIAHPKHVHIFKNVISELENHGHDCLALVIEKDVVISLLDYYDINYKVIGEKQSSLLKRILSIILRLNNIHKQIREYKPDLIIGQADPFFAIVSKLLNKSFIALPDTENAFLTNLLALPILKYIIASNSYNKNKNGITRVNSYLELSYLHPKVFEPDPQIKGYLSLKKSDNYTLIRFVNWDAHHDIGHKGISLENKIKVVKEFSKYSKVFISSEGELPLELKKYEIEIPIEKMHDVLANATLFYGESATMAAESAILGTPSVYIDNKGRGYTDDLETKYGLLYNFSESLLDQERSIQTGIKLLSLSDVKDIWNNKQQNMLRSILNYSEFLVWFIESFPESHKIMEENPEYQNRFK